MEVSGQEQSIRPALRSPRLRWAFLAVISIIVAASTSSALVPCRVRDLQAGYEATCMVLDSAVLAPNGATVPAGGAMCFGRWAQLGANVTEDSAAPLPVVGLASAGVNVAIMETGKFSETSCGVFVNPSSGWRQLRCTGANSGIFGRLGCGFTTGNYASSGVGSYQITPCDAAGLPPPSSSTQVAGVTSGAYHTVAWLDDGRVFAAGLLPYNGLSSNSVSFMQVATGLSNARVVSCAAGSFHTCCLVFIIGGIVQVSKVICWGDNLTGQLGVPNLSATSTPVEVPGLSGVAGLTGVVQLDAGYGHTAALLAVASVVSWGANDYGQLGDGGATTWSHIPVPAANLTGVVQVSAGGVTSCARLTNGDVRCWGANFNGEAGSGASCSSCTTPQAPVPGVSGVASVTVGAAHVCVVLPDKTASCWGAGYNGQLSGSLFAGFAASPGRVVMCVDPNDVCAASPCKAAGGAVTCVDKPGTDTTAAGRTCNCTSATQIYSEALGCYDPDACAASPCKAAGGAVTCVDKPGTDTTAAGRTCNCTSADQIYSEALGCYDPDACAASPCKAAGGAVTCVGKPGTDTTAAGRTCNCSSADQIYSEALGCYDPHGCATSPCNATIVSIVAGCLAPPPTGGTTSMASYQSCNTTPSASSYPLGTACTATCAAGSSGGWAKCGLSASGAAVWQVTQCTPDCSSAGLPAVSNAGWSCGASVPAGGSCSGSCAAGFQGGLTAVCVGPSWSSTTGSCTRVACIGPPPSGAPNATFQCASTPIGQPCVAVCAAGLSGSPRRKCLADGSSTWGALEGEACVDCAANQPKLTADQPSTSVAAGSTAVSTQFTFTAPFIKGSTTLLATLDGLTACTTQPAELTGAFDTPTAITVTCQAAGGGISAGPHKIAVTATTTGSNGCTNSGATTTLVDILAMSAPTPAPSVQLAAAAGAAPSACKAAAGQPSIASATFTYAMAPAASATGGLVLETEVAASAAGAAICTAVRSGGLERGTLKVTCRGVFDSLTSLEISVTLKASTPGSPKAIATSGQAVAFICCTAATTLSHAVNTDAGSSDYRTCGSSASAVDGVWLRGGLQAGVMRAGAISASTCSSVNASDVGSITAVCDEQNSRLLRVTITNPAGSAATKIEFLARCNIETVTPNMPSCLSPGPYSWRRVTPALNSLTVTTGPSGEQIQSFIILQTSTQAACNCGTSFFAIKQTGAFSTGRPVSSSGSCSAAASVSGKTGRAKAKVVAGLPAGRRRF